MVQWYASCIIIPYISSFYLSQLAWYLIHNVQVNSGSDASKMLGSHALRRKALVSSFLQLYGTFLPLLLVFGQVLNNIGIPIFWWWITIIVINKLLGDILFSNYISDDLQICMDAVFMLFVAFRYYQQQQQHQHHSEEWIAEESREGAVKVKNWR